MVPTRTARRLRTTQWAPPVLPARTLAALALVGANAMWGASIVGGKLVLDHVPPLTLALVRCLVAVAVLLPLLRLRGGRPALGREPALLGLTGVALFFLCYNLGLRATTATNATLILDGGEPFLTALLAAALLGERLTGRRLGGIATALAGIATIVLLGQGATLDLGLRALGDLLMLGSALAWAAYTVLGRRAFASAGLLEVVAGASLYGALFLLPAAAVELAVVGIGAVTASDLLLILYLGAGCSGLAYVLLGYGLRHLEAGEAGAFGYLAPVTGLGAAVLVLHESVTAGQAAGAALIVGGVWLVAGVARPPESAAAPTASSVAAQVAS